MATLAPTSDVELGKPFDGITFGMSNDDRMAQKRKELIEAGISPVIVNRQGQEGPTIEGILLYPSGKAVKFSRGSFFWSVSSPDPMPMADAISLNDRFGKVIRAEGFSSGQTFLNRSISSWDVDRQGVLSILVKELNARFGSPIPVNEDFVINFKWR